VPRRPVQRKGMAHERKGAGFLVVTAMVCLALTACHPVTQKESAVRLDAGSQTMLKSQDIAFAVRAARGGVAEVQLGKLAHQKASDPDVKAFGQKMVQDHAFVNEKLIVIARKQNITLPSAMDANDQRLYDKLQRLSGPRFDQAYMKAMVKDHTKDIKEFEKEANKGKDPEIKSFAADTLPTLQAHLQLAKSDASKTSGGSPSE